MRELIRAVSVSASALTLLVSVSVLAGDGAGPKGNEIELVTHPKNDRGRVVCALFNQAGWLKTPTLPAYAKIKNNTAVCRFTGVPIGTWGISAYHDENANGKLDTNALGMPTEDYGASRDARGTFGPPSFEDAMFVYRGGRLQLTARLK
jgi:uncharacterized protein (DUF2141 family)